jgi:hypothetical protein
MNNLFTSGTESTIKEYVSNRKDYLVNLFKNQKQEIKA